MKKEPIKVAITGAAGQIGYSLIFRIAAGEMFGDDQPLILHLIEIEPAMKILEAVVMELEDCAFPLVQKIIPTLSLEEGFEDINWAILVGAAPRKAGMERKDLIGINGKIFAEQAQAIQKYAASDVRILVVGNPCNTNCLIAMRNAPEIPQDRWFAMSRLDENRAKSLIAKKAQVHVSEVTNMAVWGNHSSTQYPDFYNAKIRGVPLTQVIQDELWLQTEFINAVQQRGAQVIKIKGSSSAASAANAIIDTIQSIIYPTAPDDWHSLAICSDGSYGIEPGLICSFPVRNENGQLTIVQGLQLNEFAREKIRISVAELKEEAIMASIFIPK